MVMQETILILRRNIWKHLGEMSRCLQLTSKWKGEREPERERNAVIMVETKWRVCGCSLGYVLNFLVCLKTFMTSCRKHTTSCPFLPLGNRRGAGV